MSGLGIFITCVIIDDLHISSSGGYFFFNLIIQSLNLDLRNIVMLFIIFIIGHSLVAIILE